MTAAQRDAFDSILPRPHRLHFIVAATTALASLAALYMGNGALAVFQACLCAMFTLLGVNAMKRRKGALALVESFEEKPLVAPGD